MTERNDLRQIIAAVQQEGLTAWHAHAAAILYRVHDLDHALAFMRGVKASVAEQKRCTALFNLPNQQFAVVRCDDAELVRHVEQYHYLHRWPDPRSLPFGYALEVAGQRYQADGRLSGLVVFKKPQHHRQAGLFGYPGLPTAWQVLDLARVWIHPDLQIGGLNVFSRMISRALHRVQWDWLEHHPPVFPHLPYHITLIISYCELAHHDGVAYRASGFERWGISGDGKKEVYVRRLKAPLKRWIPRGVYQPPLWADMPLVHRRAE